MPIARHSRKTTRERSPLSWANTQDNLAFVLTALGERETDSAGLEEAVATFRKALTESTRERAPVQWARTQNNLGRALLLLAKRETGTARLEAALAAFRAALTERTRERMPIQWAQSTANEGDALLVLAERLSNAGLAQQAVYQLEQATEAIPDRSYNDADWVYYRARLLKARALLEQLKPVRMVGKIARWFGFQGS